MLYTFFRRNCRCCYASREHIAQIPFYSLP